MPADALLLDTHALLWWQAGSDRLSAAARVAIEAASPRLISPITCWEVAMLVDRGRVALDRPIAAWFHDVMDTEDVRAAELTPSIAVAAGQLPDFHGDPADRLIFATAAALAVPLVTKDQRLIDAAAQSGAVATVW